MPSTASIRDLRNHFPKVRRIVEAEGEVLLLERGKARYRLTPYVERRSEAVPTLDYWARLTAQQPSSISAEAAQQLTEENRGDR